MLPINKADCTKCQPIVHDDGGMNNRITVPPCVCNRQIEFYNKLYQSGLDAQYGKCTFDSYIGYTKDTANAKKNAKKYPIYAVKKQPNSLGLLGNIGSGKTHLMWAICHELVNLGVNVEYIRYVDLISLYQSRYSRSKDFIEAVERLKSAGAVMMDDLFKGGNRNIASIKQEHIQLVYDIVDSCYFRDKPFIFTSEFKMEGIQDIDVAITSRLYQMMRYNNQNFVIPIDSPNFRNLDKPPGIDQEMVLK